MNDLQGTARVMLETAARSIEAGMGAGDWTIFYGPGGGLQMIAGAERSLESLSWTHGATSAWQIRQYANQVSVEGLDETGRCVIEASPRIDRRRLLLADCRLYELGAA